MDIIHKYFKNLTETQIEQFSKLQELYQDWNLKINVVSRKDIDELYLRHVLHSLGRIAKKQNHNLKNGILYLKGGDLSEELQKYTSATIYDLPTYFDEDFFETKKVVHLGMKFKG